MTVETGRLPFTQSLSVPLTCWDLQMGISESWFFQNTDLNTDLCWVNLSSQFLICSSVSSWNPCVWGEIHRFPGKSLDKSLDFMDFINPWIYQIYLSIIIFSSTYLCLGVDMTVAKLHFTLSMAVWHVKTCRCVLHFWGNPWIYH